MSNDEFKSGSKLRTLPVKGAQIRVMSPSNSTSGSLRVDRKSNSTPEYITRLVIGRVSTLQNSHVAVCAETTLVHGPGMAIVIPLSDIGSSDFSTVQTTTPCCHTRFNTFYVV